VKILTEMPFSEFHRIDGKKLQEVCPCILTYNGEKMFVIASPEDAIIIGDLHPRVRHQLIVREQKARKGMPKPQHFDKAIEAIEAVTGQVIDDPTGEMKRRRLVHPIEG
jgi:hypothetical protein